MTAALHLDFECASELDLKKVGAERYAQDKSTVVTCMAWAYDEGPVFKCLLPKFEDIGNIFYPLKENYTLHAWNASFELAILQQKFTCFIPAEKVRCTMQRSLHAGLPAALKLAGRALGARMQKSDDKVMREMMKPRKDGTWLYKDKVLGPAKLDELADYCAHDVMAERDIGKLIPNLPAEEQRVSILDRRINARGLMIDMALVTRLARIAQDEQDHLNVRCGHLTGGLITSPGTQHVRLLKWLGDRGVVIPSLAEEIVQETLETAVDAGLPADAIEVLGIRQKAAKSSVAKLEAMRRTVLADGRVRGTLQYYGAARTGRFAGRLLQIQNMPKPTIRYVAKAIAMIMDGLDADGIRLLHGDPLEVVASCLRGCIVPGLKRLFLVFDFSQIEARIVAWLAGQQDMVDLFASGEDVYVETALKYRLNSRDAGKVVVLGLGFGTGAGKFLELAKGYGVLLTAPEADKIVAEWRQANRHVVNFWYDLDRKIRELIVRYFTATSWAQSGIVVVSPALPEFIEHCGRLTLRMAAARDGKPLLTIKLPSGRWLYYRNIRIETEPKTDTDSRTYDSIVYDGMVQSAWLPIRSWGAKFFENCVQAIARDILVEAELRLDSGTTTEGIVGSVHDEIIMEVGEDDAEAWLPEVAKEIEVVPNWAKGLPIKASGKIMKRYGKG
jgi:DNA polymerase bacteriophage-type